MSLQGFNKSRAYLIGISDYTYPIKKLSTPVKDIVGIAKCLSDFDTITKRAHLTKLRFEVFLEEIIKEVNNSGTDRVLFYFAGHGTTINNTKGPEGFLILKNDAADENSGNYKIADLVDKLNELTCKHLLLVLDCCFAGAVQWDITKRGAGRKNEEKITDPLYRIFSGNNAWQIITSAAANQEALNAYDLPVKKMWGDGLRNEESNNSPFAIQFINALKGLNKEKFFTENIITANRLYTYIFENLTKDIDERKINHEQVPGLFTFLNHRNGQFIFSLKNEKFLPAIIADIGNPYKGFESYTEDDGEIFFGRDSLIASFRKDAETSRNFLVTGASGIGKSSVVKAGFIPCLLKGINKPLITRPSTFDENTYNSLKNIWDQGSSGPHVLFFDQFEEFLDLLNDEKEDKRKNKVEQVKADKVRSEKQNEKQNKKKQIKKIIREAAIHKDVYVFVAIRSDKKRKLVETNEVDWSMFKEIIIPFPDSTDIEDIIVKPALRYAWVIRATGNEDVESKYIDIKKDEAFINTIVEAYSEPGSLSFLSTALHQWFERSRAENSLEKILKQEIWGRSNSIEEVFNKKMQEIILKSTDPLPFQMIMFRLLHYNENNPVRKKLELKYTRPEDAGLIEDLENERITHKIEDKESIELAHDSIIEKWLVNQSWFKDRNNRSNGDIAALIEAQNKLIPDVQNWKRFKDGKGFGNWRKARTLLWKYQEELPVLKSAIQAVEIKDGIIEHIKSTIFHPSEIDVKDPTYFNKEELDFIKRSVKRSKIGAKLYYQIGLLIMLGLAMFLIVLFLQIAKTKKEANKNEAYLYAEKSLNQGETEALYLLRMADSLYSGTDSFILDRINSLFYERDFVGDPFAIVTKQIDPHLDKFWYNSVNDKLIFYNYNKDSLFWDYKNNIASDNYSPKSTEGTRPKEGRRPNTFTRPKIDSILVKSKATDYSLSEEGDSLFVLTENNTISEYRIYTRNDLTLKYSKSFIRNAELGVISSLSFSPQKKYIVFHSSHSISTFKLTAEFIGKFNIQNNYFLEKYFFNANEDKIFFSFYYNTKDDYDSLKYYDLKKQVVKATKIKIYDSDEISYAKNDEIIIQSINNTDNKSVFIKHNLITNEDTSIAEYSSRIGSHSSAEIKFAEETFLVYKPKDSVILFSENKTKALKINPASGYEYTKDANFIYSSEVNTNNNLMYTKVYKYKDSIEAVLGFSSINKPVLIQSIDNNKKFAVRFSDNSYYIFNNKGKFNSKDYLNPEIITFGRDIPDLPNVSFYAYGKNIFCKIDNNIDSLFEKDSVIKNKNYKFYFRYAYFDKSSYILSGSYQKVDILNQHQWTNIYFNWNIKSNIKVFFENRDEDFPLNFFSFSPDGDYFVKNNQQTDKIDIYKLKPKSKVYSLNLPDVRNEWRIIFAKNGSKVCLMDENASFQIKYSPTKITEMIKSKLYPRFPHLLNPK